MSDREECQFCGAPLAPNTNACDACGQPVPSQDSPPPEVPESFIEPTDAEMPPPPPSPRVEPPPPQIYPSQPPPDYPAGAPRQNNCLKFAVIFALIVLVLCCCILIAALGVFGGMDWESYLSQSWNAHLLL